MKGTMQRRSTHSENMPILFFSLIIIVFDQISKLMIKSRFNLHESYQVFGNMLHFTYVQNPGIAFGIHFGTTWFYALFAGIASLFLLFYIYRMRRSRFAFRLALAFILGGAIGNLIDRFAHGEVIDFIEIGFATWRWPFIFNVADIAVSIGIVILIVLAITEKEETESLPPNPM
jgi:signal peptidase II